MLRGNGPGLRVADAGKLDTGASISVLFRYLPRDTQNEQYYAQGNQPLAHTAFFSTMVMVFKYYRA